MNLNKNDFYYGSLLSKLVNGGFAPAIMEKKTKEAPLYYITNNFGEYRFYTKYVSKVTPHHKKMSNELTKIISKKY